MNSFEQSERVKCQYKSENKSSEWVWSGRVVCLCDILPWTAWLKCELYITAHLLLPESAAFVHPLLKAWKEEITKDLIKYRITEITEKHTGPFSHPHQHVIVALTSHIVSHRLTSSHSGTPVWQVEQEVGLVTCSWCHTLRVPIHSREDSTLETFPQEMLMFWRFSVSFPWQLCLCAVCQALRSHVNVCCGWSLRYWLRPSFKYILMKEKAIRPYWSWYSQSKGLKCSILIHTLTRTLAHTSEYTCTHIHKHTRTSKSSRSALPHCAGIFRVSIWERERER